MCKEKSQTECERVKNFEKKVEWERQNQFVLQVAFALRNKGFSGTTMESLQLSSAPSLCNFSQSQDWVFS